MLTARARTPITIACYQSSHAFEQWARQLQIKNGLILFEGVVPAWLEQFCQERGWAIEATNAGCLCCLGGPVLKTELIRALRKHQPEKVLIIAGIHAQLSALADAIQSPLLETVVQLNELVWITQSDLEDSAGSDSSRFSLWAKNRQCCTAHVIVKPKAHELTIHSQLSIYSDAFVLWSCSSAIKFSRTTVIDQLGRLVFPNDIEFVLRTERDWYWLSGFGAPDESTKGSIDQVNWRHCSQMLYRNYESAKLLQKPIKTKQINDLIQFFTALAGPRGS